MCQPSEDVIKVVTFNPPDMKVLDCLPLFISAGTWQEKVQKSKTAFYMESAGYSSLNPDLCAVLGLSKSSGFLFMHPYI